MGSIVNIIAVIALTILVFFQGYFFVIALGALRSKKGTQKTPPQNNIAVLIPARNEARVIGNILGDLTNQQYPEHLFKVFVIADHCTDDTAEICSEMRVETIRRTCGQPTKSQAVFDGMQRVIHYENVSQRNFDAVVIFDADNRIPPEFLSAMNDELNAGHRYIQAYLGTKNASDSWVTVGTWGAYTVTNRMWQQAKNGLGLSATAGGTGLCISMDLLRDMTWPHETLTDDLELNCHMILKGIPLTWCSETVTYDEKPQKFTYAVRQRIRWFRGHIGCMRRYFVPLTVNGIKKRDLKSIDQGLYLLTPIAYYAILVMALLFTLSHYGLISSREIPSHPALTLWFLSAIVVYPAIGLKLEGRSWKNLGIIPVLMLFAWVWVLAAVLALVHPTRQHWVPTPHGHHDPSEPPEHTQSAHESRESEDSRNEKPSGNHNNGNFLTYDMENNGGTPEKVPSNGNGLNSHSEPLDYDRTQGFIFNLTVGQTEKARKLRGAFAMALGKTMFLFGLILFLYVYVTVYVTHAASVDWYIHHWVPWLRMDVAAAIGLIMAIMGFFLYNFVKHLNENVS